MQRWSAIGRRVTFAVMLAMLVLAAGCADGDDDSSGSRSSRSDTEGSSGTSLGVLAMNQLNGVECPVETDQCDAPDRLKLLFRDIDRAGCPEIIGLTEISARQVDLISGLLPELCDGEYEMLYENGDGAPAVDEEMILTTLDVLENDYVELAGIPWSAHWTKLRSSIGTVDYMIVHQASSPSNPRCTAELCPPICSPGDDTGTCNTREVLAYMDANASPGEIQIVSGDLGAAADDTRLVPYSEAGYRDAFIEAGNDECDDETGTGCTCCIASPADPYDGGGLDDRILRRTTRTDFVLVRNASECALGFGEDTALFAGPAAAEPVGEVYWPSDHAGVFADLNCR